MRFMVHAVSAAQFEAWANTTRTAGKPLDAASYTSLLRPQVSVDAQTFGGVETRLFEHALQLAAPMAAASP
jgi:hypothetical protein